MGRVGRRQSWESRAHLDSVGHVPARLPRSDLGFVVAPELAPRPHGLVLGTRGRQGCPIAALVMDVSLDGRFCALFPARLALGFQDVHLESLTVLKVEVVAVREAHRLFIRGRLKTHPGEHAAHLGLGFVGHGRGHIGQLAAE